MTASEILFRIRQAGLKKTLTRQLNKLAGSPVSPGPRGTGNPLPQKREGCLLPEPARLEAKEILSGKWPALHGMGLEVGSAPDWHRDYLAGLSFGGGLSSLKLNHRSLPQGMDPRLVWEINRWQHLTRLAQAAWLDKDGPAAGRVVELMDSWCAANPPGTGLNWTSSLEVGIRLLNLNWIDALLRDVLPDPSSWDRLLGRILPAHTWWAWAFRSPGSSANNHLLGELAGLIVTVARWPAAARFAVPLDQLAALLYDQISRQFAADGGNREQALHYHFFAWEISLHALRSLELAGFKIPAEISGRMRGAASFWLALEGGEEAWDYGDSDDAIVVPLGGFSHAQEAWRKWMSREESEVGFWLGSTADFARPVTAPALNPGTWQIFRDSGYAVLRNDRAFLRLDASPLGYLSGAGHGHLDALHLSVWIGGMAFLVDPGTGGYYANPEERNVLASAESHNGPFAPEADYPIRRGPFLWQRHHPTPGLQLDPAGVLQAELKLGKKTVLRRQIAMQNEDGNTRTLAVSDSVSGHPGRPFHVRWILAPSWQLKDRTAHGAIFTRDEWQVEFSADSQWETVQVSDPQREDHGGALVSPAFRQFEHGLLIHLTGKQDSLPHTSHWKIHGL